MSRLTGPELRAGAVLSFGGLVAVLDATIVVVALPRLMAAFDASLAEAQWVVTAYPLAMVATMPLAAGLAARWGARRVYLGALAGFAIASAAASAAGGLGWLVAARAVQGLGGGLMTPLGMALGFGAVPPERRGRMISITGLPLLVGPILGPVLGAVLLATGSWRALFLVTVPLAVLGMAGVLAWLPADPPGRRTRLDLAGAVLLVPGVVAVAYGISAEDAAPAVRVGAAVAGTALVAAFSVRALAHPEPLLRVRLLSNPTLGRGAAVLALYAAPYFGTALLTPTYVQLLRADSPSVTAALAVPAALGMGIAVQTAARLLERLGPRFVVATGLALAIASGLVTAVILRPDTPYPALGALGFLQGAGSGAIMMPTISSSTRELHGSDLASGSALLSLVSTVANGIGTVTFSTLLTVLTTAITGESLVRTAVAGAVDAQRLTRLVAVLVMSLALVVRLRSPRRDSATLETATAVATPGGES